MASPVGPRCQERAIGVTPTDDEISRIEDEDVVVRTLASLTVPSARPQC
jgi:hypothetical protein